MVCSGIARVCVHVNNKSEVVGIYVLSTSNRNLYNNIEGVVVVIMLAMLHGCGCLIIIIGRGILTRRLFRVHGLDYEFEFAMCAIVFIILQLKRKIL